MLELLGMSARERLLSAIRREGPDRVPISLWWHAYNLNAGIGFREFARDGKKNAMAHLAFLKDFDVDFLKVTPDGLFFLEDWGGRLEYDEGAAIPKAAEYAVKSAEDWERLEALDPRRAKLHYEQLRSLEVIAERLGDFPFLETVFNPFTIAIKIAGEGRVREDMRKDPRALKEGLKVITETTIDFIKEALEIGAIGIFYSIKTLSAKSITRAEFEEFNKPYDLKIMDSMRDADVVMIHAHNDEQGDDLLIDEVLDYGANSLHWWDKGTTLSLERARAELSDRFSLAGGIDHKGTMLRTPSEVEAEIRDAIRAVGGEGFILGPGCTLSPRTPRENMLAAIAAARKYGKSG
ncbi:MAG: uroporphyrinogen decarboxylase family protein [Candidatus Bathyarchaeia archaeon]